MIERPFYLSPPMIYALLNGEKTQTRQRVRFTPELGDPAQWKALPEEKVVGDVSRFCPLGRPGDRLWLKESWMTIDPIEGFGEKVIEIGYKTARDNRCDRIGFSVPDRVFEKYSHENFSSDWRHPNTMPRWASRVVLDINKVELQRLHDITEEEAIAEGSREPQWTRFTGGRLNEVEVFLAMWSSLYGMESMKANPWCWVISFSRRS